MKVIRIDGIRGLFTALFICAGLFAGFIISPGYLAMHLWNTYAVNLLMFPPLNLLQGVLLWSIIAISYCIITKNDFAMSFKNTPELSEKELDAIIKNSQKFNSQVQVINKIIAETEKSKKNPFPSEFDSKKEDNNKQEEQHVSNLK